MPKLKVHPFVTYLAQLQVPSTANSTIWNQSASGTCVTVRQGAQYSLQPLYITFLFGYLSHKQFSSQKPLQNIVLQST